jgi:release factor glutamine methyltransferase
MTIAEALNVQQRTVSSRDAEVLLAAVLGCERAYLHSHPEELLSPAAAQQYEDFLCRREANEPVAYITGVKEFYGRLFNVDKRVLIPRPETELLVAKGLEWSMAHFAATMQENLPCPVRILELGTGAGVVAVTLGIELARKNVPSTIVATEIDDGALTVAKENWKHLSAGEPVHNTITKWAVADLFDHPDITKRPFDLIIANLPYVETTWQVETGAQPDVVFYEPDVALFGGKDGLDLYRRFFAEAPAHLCPGGAVMIEYGETQTAAISHLAAAALPEKQLQVFQDYAGLDRVITLT